MSESLTIKQEKFCQEYLITGKAAVAYREAYDTENMGQDSIRVEANKLLNHPKVSLRIKELQEEAYERNKATIDEVLSIASDMLRADISEAYDEEGNIKKVSEIPKRLRMAISGLESSEIVVDKEKVGEVKKLRLSDRTKVLDMFMKHFGGYDKDNEQKQNNITIFRLPDNGR
jgi:phage terminase small subunit